MFQARIICSIGCGLSPFLPANTWRTSKQGTKFPGTNDPGEVWIRFSSVMCLLLFAYARFAAVNLKGEIQYALRSFNHWIPLGAALSAISNDMSAVWTHSSNFHHSKPFHLAGFTIISSGAFLCKFGFLRVTEVEFLLSIDNKNSTWKNRFFWILEWQNFFPLISILIQEK